MCRSRCITKAKFRRIKSWHGSDSSVNHFSTNFSQTLLLKQVGMSRWTHSLKIWNKDVGEKTKPKLKKVFLKLKLYGISYQQNKSSKLCISWVVGFTVLMNVTRRIHTLSAVKSSSYMDIKCLNCYTTVYSFRFLILLALSMDNPRLTCTWFFTSFPKTLVLSGGETEALVGALRSHWGRGGSVSRQLLNLQLFSILQREEGKAALKRGCLDKQPS